ncbi:MAG: TetR family transcriptional regulator [Proteobacteria bacterium]|nr:TetR family transcriptional regulator [Pseudomonadota bacterium]
MKKKTEEKRQAIVDAAAEVFRELGFERASMAEICRRVGFSSATLYNYFSSKETLFYEVVYEANEAEFQTVHELLNHATEDIADALRHFGERLLALIYSPDIMAVRRLVTASFGHGEFSRNCFEQGPKRSISELSAFLLEAMKNGKLRQCDPVVATLHLRGLLESELLDTFIFQIEGDIDPERIKGIVGRAVAVFMAAYGPPSARQDVSIGA